MTTTTTRTVTRKISLSGAKLSAVLAANGKLFIGRVAGIATGTKEHVHATYGLSIGLVGAFRVRYPDGSEVSAPVAWGPDVLIEPVVSALKAGAMSVNVLADVYAVTSESSPVGFMYVLETHGDEESDPVAALMATMPEMPALPAPAPAKGKKNAG